MSSTATTTIPAGNAHLVQQQQQTDKVGNTPVVVEKNVYALDRPNKPVGSSLLSPVYNLVDRLGQWRASFNLPNPGVAEHLGKEVKMTQLTNYFFDGLRADLTKGLSLNPAFQVTHSFLMGSQGSPMEGVKPGTYSFGGVFADSKRFLQGNIDNDGSLVGRANYAWTPEETTKVQLQLAPSSAGGMSMYQLEHDHLGSDYSVNLKTYNYNPVDNSGIFMASYLQSITPNFALGVETVLQRMSAVGETSLSYMAKLTGANKDWIATAQALPQGAFQATYWQKLAERIDAAADFVLVPGQTVAQRKSIATVGLKYEFRMSTFRAQIDSSGKVAALLEQRLSPIFAFLLSTELDQFKNTCRYGFGIMIESASPELEETLQKDAGAATPVKPPI